MNYNKPLGREEKELLMRVSKGSQKGRNIKPWDPVTGTDHKFQRENPENTMYDNLPVRGNWKNR